MIAMIKTIMDKIGNGVSSPDFSLSPSPDIVFEQGLFFSLGFPPPLSYGKTDYWQRNGTGGKGDAEGNERFF